MNSPRISRTKYLKSDGDALLTGTFPTFPMGAIVAVTLGEMLSFLGKFWTLAKSWFDGFLLREPMSTLLAICELYRDTYIYKCNLSFLFCFLVIDNDDEGGHNQWDSVIIGVMWEILDCDNIPPHWLTCILTCSTAPDFYWQLICSRRRHNRFVYDPNSDSLCRRVTVFEGELVWVEFAITCAELVR